MRITGGIGSTIEHPEYIGLRYRLGGGIYIANGAECSINSCHITENFLYGGDDLGGGIYCSESSPYISNCVIDYNVGGGIHFNESDGLVWRCEINNNSYGGNISGGIYCVNSTPSIYYTTIANNNMPGIRLVKSGDYIVSCDIHNNHDSGIYATEGSYFRMYYTTITGNIGFVGGGIACLFNSSPEIYGCLVSNNTATFRGGGIFMLEESSMIIRSSDIDFNGSLRGCGTRHVCS